MFAGAPLLPFNKNLLLLRFAEYDGELHRLFCVRIIGTAHGAHRLLKGLARPLKSGASWPAAGGRR